MTSLYQRWYRRLPIALQIALVYAIFSVLWILLSDRLIWWLVDDRERLESIAVIKGLAFVLSTSALIYVLVARFACGMAKANEQLQLDILERKRVEAQLQLAAQAFAATRDGIVMVDASGHITAVNRAYTKITGYAEAELIGQEPRIFQSGVYDKAFYDDLWQSLLTKNYWEGEMWSRRKNGQLFAERLSITTVLDEHQKPTGYIGIASDISERKLAEEKLQTLINYDGLTGLPSRTLLRELGNQKISGIGRHGGSLAVCYIDLDHFKSINDALGHAAGDQLLSEIGQRLAKTLREGDVVSHWSGDEFVILLVDTDRDHAVKVAQRLLTVVAAPYAVADREIAIGASIGIALFPEHGMDLNELLRNADTASHNAKLAGRNTFSFFQQNMNADASEQFRLETDLRSALKRNELELHYQPQTRLSDGQLVGFEALLRWRHPTLGLVPPSKFIPIAESRGLMTSIGTWVIEAACRQNQAWRVAGLADVVIAVNLSAVQLRGNVVSEVKRILAATALPADKLELELTESLLLDHAADTLAQFRALKSDLGVRLAIDDFGTGYSNLGYLSRFPADKLKIDQSFVFEMNTAPSHRAIVDAIVGLGHSLHLTVIAEGVETSEQAAALSAIGCDEVQGYFYGRPMPVSDVESWLRQRTR